jgi:hypothetical protein
MLADRSEQGLGEAAVTATADHEQVRTVRGAPFVLPADIGFRPSAFFIRYPKGHS